MLEYMDECFAALIEWEAELLRRVAMYQSLQPFSCCEAAEGPNRIARFLAIVKQP